MAPAEDEYDPAAAPLDLAAADALVDDDFEVEATASLVLVAETEGWFGSADICAKTDELN
jgi:hypothetical protein